jgi:hypothetical protein
MTHVWGALHAVHALPCIPQSVPRAVEKICFGQRPHEGKLAYDLAPQQQGLLHVTVLRRVRVRESSTVPSGINLMRRQKSHECVQE